MRKVWKTLKRAVMMDMPLFAVALLIAAAFYAGGVLNSHQPNGKYVVAEKSAVVLQAVFDRRGESQQQLVAEVSTPVLAILKKYADEGYVVIDAAKDENGNMVVAALPDDAKDITQELTAAIGKAPK